MGEDDLLGVVGDEIGQIVGAVGIVEMAFVGDDAADQIIRTAAVEKHLRIMVGFEDIVSLPFDGREELLGNEAGIRDIG
jgi:hypothetical protein